MNRPELFARFMCAAECDPENRDPAIRACEMMYEFERRFPGAFAPSHRHNMAPGDRLYDAEEKVWWRSDDEGILVFADAPNTWRDIASAPKDTDIIMTDGKSVVIGYYDAHGSKRWMDDYGKWYELTHWMPLPEPPKEER